MNPEALALQLRKAQETRTPCAPLREHLPDAAAAYAVQEANTQFWLAHGRRLVGRKIGLTAKAVQKQLGVDEPDYGMLYADMCMGDAEEIPRGAVLQPKVEGEVAFVLQQSLPNQDATGADLIRATAYCLPAIEIVGSRIANWDIKLVDTIADNASSGLFVLGTRPVPLRELDLHGCAMIMTKNGDKASSGTGAACMGNPLNAAVWLARTMARAGRPLQAGDVVMSGALGPMAGVAPGDAVTVEISGLGSVRTIFS
jgi:2-keto-4-pentenoate hydratase